MNPLWGIFASFRPFCPAIFAKFFRFLLPHLLFFADLGHFGPVFRFSLAYEPFFYSFSPTFGAFSFLGDLGALFPIFGGGAFCVVWVS